MKKLTKLALAIGLAGVAASAVAQVRLVDGNGDELVTYSYSSLVAENNQITITGASYQGGSLPGFEPGELTCGTGTTQSGSTCVVDIGAVCGLNTSPNQAETQCIAEAPDLTPPTLGITSSPTAMGDGVSSSLITFQFSRDVSGFTQSDVSVSPSGHSLSGFNQIDGDTWQATLNRNGNNSGTISVSVSSGSYQGTNGVAGGGASRSITLTGGTTNVGDCTVPSNVQITSQSGLTSFGGPSNAITTTIPQYPGILSSGFTTGPSSTASGRVEMAGTVATVEHTRQMWISECPGGDPLPSSRCLRSGQDVTMIWALRSIATACSLQRNTQYYFNVAYHPDETSCNNSNGCTALIQHLGGW